MADYVDRAQFIADQYTQDCVQRQLSHGQHTARPDAGPRSCEGCGADIPAARLRVVPGTRLCVDCQDMKERRNGRIY